MNSRFKHLPFKRLLQDFGVTNAVDSLFLVCMPWGFFTINIESWFCWFALNPLRPAWTNLYRKKTAITYQPMLIHPTKIISISKIRLLYCIVKELLGFCYLLHHPSSRIKKERCYLKNNKTPKNLKIGQGAPTSKSSILPTLKVFLGCPWSIRIMRIPKGTQCQPPQETRHYQGISRGYETSLFLNNP